MVSLLRGTSAEDGLATRYEANLPPLEWTAAQRERIRDNCVAAALGIPQKRGSQSRFIKNKLLNISGEK